MKFSTSASLGLLWLCGTSVASPLHQYQVLRYTHTKQVADPTDLNVTQDGDDATVVGEFTVDLPLNHSDPSAGTFANRYFITDDVYEEGGPIIINDGGEGAASPPDNSTYLWQYAQKYKGMIVTWEHRYYGKSLPEIPDDLNPSSPDADPEALSEWYKYLSVDNALDDLAMFAKNFTYTCSKTGETKDLSTGKAPWIMVGASYPGVRTAWMQVRHPGVINFGLASSAPIGFKVDYWEYYAAAERAMASHNMIGCAADIHNVADYLSKRYNANDTEALGAFLQTYGTANETEDSMPAFNSLDDYADTINQMWTLPFGDFQGNSIYSQYDPTNPALAVIGIKDFCTYFQAGANTTLDKPASSDSGLSAVMDVKDVATLYAKATGDIYSRASNATDDSTEPSTNSTKSADDNTSWSYQTCTETGVFMTGNTARKTNLLPSFINVDLYIRGCKKQFGSGVPNAAGLEANLERMETQFGGRGLQLNNIVWTNGEFDPWRMLSGDADIEEDGGRQWNATQNVPKCGERLPHGTQLSYTIKEGVHGNDFDVVDDSGDLTVEPVFDNTLGIEVTTQPPVVDAKNAQALWEKATTAWLKKGCSPKP